MSGKECIISKQMRMVRSSLGQCKFIFVGDSKSTSIIKNKYSNFHYVHNRADNFIGALKAGIKFVDSPRCIVMRGGVDFPRRTLNNIDYSTSFSLYKKRKNRNRYRVGVYISEEEQQRESLGTIDYNMPNEWSGFVYLDELGLSTLNKFLPLTPDYSFDFELYNQLDGLRAIEKNFTIAKSSP